MAEQKHRCCICGKEFEGRRNNPSPVKDHGVCCDSCNWTVIFARLDAAKRLENEERRIAWER